MARSEEASMPPTKRRRVLATVVSFAIVAAAVFIAILLYQDPKPTQRMRVAIATWPGFAAGFVGQQRGYFDHVDLEFTTMDHSEARRAAFQSGLLDAMISSADVFVQERSQGLEGKIILVTDESFGGDGIVARPEIKTAADLRGRKVAYARATPSHYLLFKVLEKAGLTPDDIEQVKVEDPSNAGQAFLGGSVDAAVTWEPLLTEVAESGNGHVLASSRDFPGTIVDVLVASPKLLARPEVLQRFLRGWLKSVAYIEAHPEESARIMAQGLGVKPEDAEGMMAGLRFAGTSRNVELFSPRGASQSALAAAAGDAGGFWVRQGIIPRAPAPDDLISPVLLETPDLPGASGR